MSFDRMIRRDRRLSSAKLSTMSAIWWIKLALTLQGRSTLQPLARTAVLRAQSIKTARFDIVRPLDFAPSDQLLSRWNVKHLFVFVYRTAPRRENQSDTAGGAKFDNRYVSRMTNDKPACTCARDGTVTTDKRDTPQILSRNMIHIVHSVDEHSAWPADQVQVRSH